MGKHFGNLQKLKGVQYYTLSPHEINPMTMLLNPGLSNTIRKTIHLVGMCIVPATIYYIVYDWTETTYKKLQRKNPEEFKDDV